MFKTNKMDNDDKLNKPSPKKRSKKTYKGVVLKPVKIGNKYDWTKKRGQIVTGLTKKEYDNYKKNKIIE